MKKNIIIVILVILVLGLGGYLVYDKVLVNDNNKKVNSEQVKEENYDLVGAKYILDSFLDSGANIIDRLAEDKLDEEIKLTMAINTIESLGGFGCDDLFKTSNGLYENNGAICLTDTPMQYSYERVNEQYKKLFGTSSNAPKQDILYKYEMYGYSHEKDFYVRLSPQWGPIIPNSYYYEIQEAKTNNNELKIKISYLTYMENIFAAPTEFLYKINGVEYSTNTLDNIKQIYKDNENLLPKLTFIFEKEDNNYILKSVE